MQLSALPHILIQIFCGLALLLPFQAGAVNLQPLGVQDATTLPQGKAEFRLGVAYKDDSPLLFQLHDTDRTQVSIPELNLNLGLGKRIELQLKYELLYVDEKTNSSNFGTGDLVLGAKVALLHEDLTWPALGIRVATKLPNANDHDGRGTNETDFFVDLLTTRNYPGFSLYGNLGLAVLGDPRGNQDDKVHYAFGVSYPLEEHGLILMASIEGMDGSDDSLNDRGAVLGGLQYQVGQAVLDFGVSAGYRSRSEDWGLRAGLTTPFDLPAGW